MSTTLIIPGLRGSGADHWQTWLERRLPDARRVRQDHWDRPVLARWAGRVRREIDRAPGDVWLVAHSFGCLAAVTAAADRASKVAGAMLVAPTDPYRFTVAGLWTPLDGPDDISALLPTTQLPFPSLLVSGTNDPWVRLSTAAWWAECWSSRLVSLPGAGHINTASGFGPWPEGLELLRELRGAQHNLPLGNVSAVRESLRGRRDTLARLRHLTRLVCPG